MGKLIETALIWAALPYLALAGLAVLLNWPWQVLGVIAALVALFLFAVIRATLDMDASFQAMAREKEREAKLRALHLAMMPMGADEVPPPAGPRRAPPKPAGLPAPYRQWRI